MVATRSPAALRAVAMATAGSNQEARQTPVTSAGTIYSDAADDPALGRPGQYSLSYTVVTDHSRGDAPVFYVMILEYLIIDRHLFCDPPLNVDNTRLIDDRVDDPSVALADTIEVLPARELVSP
jgi:hypothetical protein